MEKYTRCVISHAKKGVRGGPYEHMLGPVGTAASLRSAMSFYGEAAREEAVEWLKGMREDGHPVPKAAHVVPVVKKGQSASGPTLGQIFHEMANPGHDPWHELGAKYRAKIERGALAVAAAAAAAVAAAACPSEAAAVEVLRELRSARTWPPSDELTARMDAIIKGASHVLYCLSGKHPRHETLVALQDEIVRARRKFPRNRFLFAALGEEVGEVARALLQNKGADEVRKEALQVACVALRIFEEGDSSFDDITPDESKL